MYFFKKKNLYNPNFHCTLAESSSSFKSSVHGIILGLPVPYGVPLGSMSGPIVSGQEVTYTNSLYVSPAYPTVSRNCLINPLQGPSVLDWWLNLTQSKASDVLNLN